MDQAVLAEGWIDAASVLSNTSADPFLRYHIWCGYCLHAAYGDGQSAGLEALMAAEAMADLGNPQTPTWLVLADRLLQRQAGHPAARLLSATLGFRLDLPALETALSFDPGSELINNLLGKYYRRRGQLDLAIPYLRAAFNRHGFRSHDEHPYFTTLALAGGYQELLDLTEQVTAYEGVDHVPRGDGSYRQLALAKTSLHFDRPAMIAQIRAVEASPAWLDATGVMAAFQDAVRSARPFSYIRLGDGEARFLCYMDAEIEALLTWPERSAMINSVWINWFVQPIEEFLPHLRTLKAQFVWAAATADVVGLLSSDSMVHDHYHFGFLAHMQKEILSISRGLSMRFCSALGHHDIHHRDRWFASLLKDLPFVAFVGCHPELAGKLAARFNITAHASYLVPGENGRPLPQDRKGLGHFPAAFERIMAEIAVPFQGAVFLVGAGLLGKIYCGRIKELGGIAIDIGSLADAWMGFNTRPGSFDQIANFTLPG